MTDITCGPQSATCRGARARVTPGKTTSLWFFEKLGDNAHGDAQALTRAMLLLHEFNILIGALFVSISMQVRTTCRCVRALWC